MEIQLASQFVDNRDCEWVRARLPLLVGDGAADGPDADGQGGDLAPGDGFEIERHLACCASCCQQRVALERAMTALVAAAEFMPVETDVPSLWPALERRIAKLEKRQASGWLRALRGLADRWVPIGTVLDSERPLRLAWMRDAVVESIHRRKQWALSPERRSALLIQSSIAAAALVVLIALPVVRRQWVDAQSTIAGNAAPLPDPVVVSAPDDNPPPLADPGDDGEPPARQLAEVDPARMPEISGLGPDGAALPRQGPQTRFGFDLERGISQAPDGRESKPVY